MANANSSKAGKKAATARKAAGNTTKERDQRNWPERTFHPTTAVSDHSLAQLTRASLGLTAILDLLIEKKPRDGRGIILSEFSEHALLMAATVCANQIIETTEHHQSDQHGRPALEGGAA